MAKEGSLTTTCIFLILLYFLKPKIVPCNGYKDLKLFLAVTKHRFHNAMPYKHKQNALYNITFTCREHLLKRLQKVLTLTNILRISRYDDINVDMHK